MQEVQFELRLTPTFQLSSSEVHYWGFGSYAIVILNEKVLVSLAWP